MLRLLVILALTTLHSFFELSGVVRAVGPLVLPKAVRKSFDVGANILIAVREEVSAITMPQVLEPLTFIFIFVFPHMHPIPLCLPFDPLPDVRVIFGAFPHTRSLLDSHVEFSFVNFAILPGVDATTMRLAFHILSLVNVPVGENLVAIAFALVLPPLSLVDSELLAASFDRDGIVMLGPLIVLLLSLHINFWLINDDAKAVSYARSFRFDLASVNAVSVLDHGEVRLLFQPLKVELIALHLVILKGFRPVENQDIVRVGIRLSELPRFVC